MTMSPYVNFKGDCEAAFHFYEQRLDGKPGPLFRYGGSPMADQAPPDWADKIMHASIVIGGQVLMGADVTPDRYEAPKGVSLSLHVTSAAEAERLFNGLAEGGRILMPLEQTFWAERFGMLVDRFGLSWMINCEAPRP
jgi:PhnB protein